ncbi:unnamed protein product [Anisakis simplex]|uniref:Pseudouridine-5'-monophosphatase (inferred by orthology to a human protein) n=1 Tax=Anisakis simplex TaxID=6269 RepID=A0A0M3K900_ANISI|nr:unnamed protein product [Anisakis simplex]
MAKYGKEYTIELKKLTLGMSQLPGIELVLDKVGLKDKVSVQEYAAEYDALLPELLPQCSLMKGAMRFVRHLAEHNIPRAICTGSPDLECNIKLTNHKELRDLIPFIVRGSDPEIRRGKPAPDCFLVTMNRFEKKPESSRNVLVFEDSINGTRAAISANMQAIMIPDVRFTTPPKELIAQTRMILNSFDDFKPESVGLPAYKC